MRLRPGFPDEMDSLDGVIFPVMGDEMADTILHRITSFGLSIQDSGGGINII